MDCREFRSHLPAFSSGDAPEPLFGRLVEHEACCADCHRLAVESTPAVAPERGIGPSPSTDRLRHLQRVLDRTEGDDCRFVQLRLADALEESLAADLQERLRGHVRACPDCQRIRDLLQDLPVFYDSLPHLRPSRAFTEAVFARTIGPQPSFWDVVRALWRKPEAMWEAAAACALVGVLALGGALPSYDDLAERVQGMTHAGMAGVGDIVGARSEDGDSQLFGPMREGYSAAASGASKVEGWMESTSAWSQRVGTAIERRDMTALYGELRTVLEPLGLTGETPSPEEAGESAPEGSEPEALESGREGSPEPAAEEDQREADVDSKSGSEVEGTR